MFHMSARKLLVCGALIVTSFVAAVDTAEAQARRLRFDPAYGNPFVSDGNELGWKGYADVFYGGCDGPGLVTNAPSSCNGVLSFTSATVELYNTADVNSVLQTFNFTGGQVAFMNFDNSNELTQVGSTPFTPQQGSIGETKYNGTDQAWFSLIFVGEYAQLMWFDTDPGVPVVIPPSPFSIVPQAAGIYLSCYLFGQNGVLGSSLESCGISSNLDSKGARFEVTAVPEPETYALMIAGLAAVAFMTRRRRSSR